MDDVKVDKASRQASTVQAERNGVRAGGVWMSACVVAGDAQVAQDLLPGSHVEGGNTMVVADCHLRRHRMSEGECQGSQGY